MNFSTLTCREQAQKGIDPYAAADGLWLRPSQGMETGSGEGMVLISNAQ